MDSKTGKGSKPLDDGFTLVSNRRRKKKKSHKTNKCAVFSRSVNSKTDENDTSEKNLSFKRYALNDIQNEVENSDFFRSCKENLFVILNHINSSLARLDETSDEFLNKNSLENAPSSLDIICYGLGRFSSSVISRYQLGFLFALKGVLKTDHVYIYDPVFSELEVDFLQELGLNVLKINEEARRVISRPTIFFMPHCELELYDNLFSVNWSPEALKNLVLIGNSFDNYKIQLCGGRFKDTAKYVYYVTGFESEIVITNSFYLTDIFNDLCIHYFRREKLPPVQSDLWDDVNKLQLSPACSQNIDKLSELFAAEL